MSSLREMVKKHLDRLWGDQVKNAYGEFIMTWKRLCLIECMFKVRFLKSSIVRNGTCSEPTARRQSQCRLCPEQRILF